MKKCYSANIFYNKLHGMLSVCNGCLLHAVESFHAIDTQLFRIPNHFRSRIHYQYHFFHVALKVYSYWLQNPGQHNKIISSIKIFHLLLNHINTDKYFFVHMSTWGCLDTVGIRWTIGLPKSCTSSTGPTMLEKEILVCEIILYVTAVAACHPLSLLTPNLNNNNNTVIFMQTCIDFDTCKLH